MNNDFIKNFKNYYVRIIYLSELPSKGINVDANTMIAIPGKRKVNINFTHGLRMSGYILHLLINQILTLKNLRMLTMI